MPGSDVAGCRLRRRRARLRVPNLARRSGRAAGARAGPSVRLERAVAGRCAHGSRGPEALLKGAVCARSLAAAALCAGMRRIRGRALRPGDRQRARHGPGIGPGRRAQRRHPRRGDRSGQRSSARRAAKLIDARGLVVAPGFINLHWHGKDPHSDYYEAMDGVTSTFELESRRGGCGPLVRRASRAHADQLRRRDRARTRAHGGDGRSRATSCRPAMRHASRRPMPSCARSSGAWSRDSSAARLGSASGSLTRRRHRAGRSCRCSVSPRATVPALSFTSAARPARAARTARRGWSRPSRLAR